MVNGQSLTRGAMVRSMATLFSGSIVAQGMTALALLLTARQLGVDGYGQYAACIAITSLASILFSLGLDLWLLREGGRSVDRLPAYAGSVLGIKALIGLAWMAAFFLLAPLLKQETYPASLLRWSVGLIWLDTMFGSLLTSFKAALRNRVPSILEASADIVWCGLTVGLIGLGIRQPGTYIIIRVLVSGTALIVGLFLLRRLVGLHFDFAVARQALRGAFPFAASEFLAMITMRADVVIVGLTLGKTATGLYSPAVGLINMAFLAPLAIYLVAVPVLSNLYLHNPAQARKTARRTILLSLALGLLLSILFVAGAPVILYILGPSYQGSVDILRILSLVLFFKSGSLAIAAVILATDQQSRRTGVQAAAALINIGANWLVVNWLGIQGVAGVYVLTEIILLAGYAWIVRRKL
ncbi:MAG TPA: oligosaccharide flippase family protein [Anaerolineales bacterium]|nr:oligosaccharide flippase family protein [Anaerolineales bacterium]